MTQELTELSDVAERVALAAAQRVLAAHQRMRDGATVAVDTKSSDTDPVTAVDKDTERLIRSLLAELRPDDPVLGEEHGGPGPVAGAVTWVVDPIDGTVNFVYGYPSFGVSVGAQVDGVSVAAAVVEPVGGRCWTATRGGGAYLDGKRLQVRRPERLELSLLATGFSYDRERRRRQAEMVGTMLGRVRDIRRGGSAALDLCGVASGWFDAFFEHGLARWDWAAGALIAEEAGATVILPGADPELADGTLAAAPTIADDLRKALIEAGAADV